MVGADAALVIDCGSTLAEAGCIADDVAALTDRQIRHVLLTHGHFDHILGASVFRDATVTAAPRLATLLATGRAELRADAVQHGADPAEIDAALAALQAPDREILDAGIELGEVTVSITHPGRGHTDHDLVALVPSAGPGDRPVLFCGDLIEESADPAIGPDADLPAWPHTLDRLLQIGGPDAIYLPGHGTSVGADFVRAQRDWLAAR